MSESAVICLCFAAFLVGTNLGLALAALWLNSPAAKQQVPRD